jgi:hypothetical protein
MPKILSWERLRSSTLIPGSINFPNRPGRFALAISRCMKWGIDLVKFKDEDEEGDCWIRNHIRFVGKPLKPDGSADRIQRYYEAVKGEAGWFLKQNNNKPSETANHMLNLTSGICVVRKKKLPNGQAVICGDCPDCIKNLGFDCPVATMVRAKMGDYGPLALKELMLLQAGPSEHSSGKQNAPNLSGLGTSKKRKKNPGKSVDDPKQFWKSYQEKSDGQFETICEDFGVFEALKGERTTKRERVKPRTSPSKLLDEIMLFEKCPTCYRGLPHEWKCKVKVLKDQCLSTADDLAAQRPTKKIISV